MENLSGLNQSEFRRVLSRNLMLPLAVGVASAVLFVVLITNLLSSLSWVEHTQKVLDEVNQLNRLMVEMQSGTRGFLLTGDEEFLNPYRIAKPRLGTDFPALKQLVQDNPAQVDRLAHLQLLVGQWDDYARTAINQKRTSGDYVAIMKERGTREFDVIQGEFNNFVTTEEQLLKERNQDARRTTAIAISAYLVFICLFTGLLSYVGRRELLRLSNSFNNALGKANQQAEILEEQAWQRAGQAKLTETSIGQTALPLLGRTILDFLALYVDQAVAALYVRSEAHGDLRRVATYGGSKTDSQDEQVFDSTESLVGQAAFSNRLIHLQQLPEDYITKGLKISSGLGQSSPTNLVLLPTEHEGIANGVLELGFLRTPTPRELGFLSLIAGNIGNILEAALARQRLQKVLEETQQLNEELQVQQEELRAANEELEEQSRALEESQAILENQKVELEQTNDKLMEQATILDQRNSDLLIIKDELEQRAQDLQRASHYKSEFLANMSHELRTPLNSAMILAKLLAENPKGNLNQEQIEFAQTIYASGNDLLNLINDILDISKVEAGKLELAPDHIQLDQLVENLRLTFAQLAQNKQLEFDARIEAGTAKSIYTDRQRLEQILKNLISNAIKFTDNGKVELILSDAGEGAVNFAVKDTGIGIAEDQQDLIFEAFQQADGSINRRYGGTGLGLSISRDLANLLGGAIHLDSKPNHGSTFSLQLPADLQMPAISQTVTKAVSQQPAPVEEPSPSVTTLPFNDDREDPTNSDRTVLVVEDDPGFARILLDLARELKYRCLVAQGAAEAIAMAIEFKPDAILLDLGLPDASGMSVLQKLKTNPATRHIPVHIVSAADSTSAALQMGAVGYVIKPTTRDRLKQVFEKLESKFTQELKRVLLVEDDPVQRQAIVHLINDEDVEITAVERGQEAIDLLRNNIYDCMIIDLKLPDMQGPELLQRMSTEAICCFPPVIVYTGRNLTREEENDLLKYSRSIIIKGARSPERLLDEVTLFLHKVESKLSSERQSMLKTLRGRDRALEGRRVLLVDDDVRNIFALSGALEQKGALVEIARNGQEAIDKLNEVKDIDVVLMDIMMPGMDGLEATRRIRQNQNFQKLPIIAVTAKAMKDDQEQCLKAGASDYLAKPIDIDRLYSLLRVWMPTVERL
jgi:CheY-like chemotaxis protein/signal transduction histidine kinase/CHASE3 domain sensor protein